VFPFGVGGLHDFGVVLLVCVGVVDAVAVGVAEGGKGSVEATGGLC
jgi:hypothetical protein